MEDGGGGRKGGKIKINIKHSDSETQGDYFLLAQKQKCGITKNYTNMELLVSN